MYTMNSLHLADFLSNLHFCFNPDIELYHEINNPSFIKLKYE